MAQGQLGIFVAAPSDGLRSYLGGAVEIDGPTDFYGWALAGPSGIKRVAISLDEGASCATRNWWTIDHRTSGPSGISHRCEAAGQFRDAGARDRRQRRFAATRGSPGRAREISSQARMTVKVSL